MIRGLFKTYIYPIATLSGAIIGVGFFALPYIALKSGVWLFLAYFLAIGSIVVILHLVFSEVSLKTPDYKRFPGFVGFHLGKWPKVLSLCSSIFGSFGVLLVYLIIGGEFLTAALQPFFGGSNLLYTLLYFAVASVAIFFGIKAVSKFEFTALILLLISLSVIFVKGFFDIKIDNLFLEASNSWKFIFLPYGAIMFSLWGMGLIPEIEEMLVGNKKAIKKVIALSILIAAVVYVLFTFLVLSITGADTTESGLLGLKDYFGDGAILFVLLIGALTTFNAFMALGLTLKKVLIYDLGVKNVQAFVITCFTPLVLFLLGLNFFIPLISFVGGVLLGIDGILVLLMYKKVGGKNLIIYPFIAVFVLGIIYQLVYIIK